MKKTSNKNTHKSQHITASYSAANLRHGDGLSDLMHKTGHEIDNPLTSIISLAAIIERSEHEDERISDFARSISAEAWRISKTIRSIVHILSTRDSNSSQCELTSALKLALKEVTKSRAYGHL